MNNLQKYESGNVNFSAANNFAPASLTKLAKGPVPRLKANNGGGTTMMMG